MRAEPILPPPATAQDVPTEDAFADALLSLARRYALARSEHELAAAFYELVPPFAPGVELELRLRAPADRVVRVFSSGNESGASVPGAVARGAIPAEVDDLEGWSLIDDPSDEGFAIAGAVESSLVAVVSAGCAIETGVHDRLARFAEQLASAVVDLAERSETARLRLYAGSIVDRTNVPIAIVDARGVMRLSNDALRTEVGGSDVLSRIDAADRPRALAAHARALRGRHSVGVEITLRIDGGEKRMLVDFEPIPLPSGTIDSVLVVGRDVTRVRQLEEQVTHADRLATLGQLAAGVVHELNNPLTSILVYTEYLLRKTESEPQDPGDREKLRRILGAAERIQEFAKNLVAYSRSERGARESLDASSVIDESVAFCEPLLDRRRVIVVRAYEDVPALPAVRGQLQQVLINLLTNAIQAVPEAHGRIVVSLAAPTHGWIAIRVDDNGPGIPRERREDIFRPFVTTKPSGQGTGLGLSIVRNLVERHGGTIDVGESSLGGASFVLSFPVKSPSEPPPTSLVE